jgi:hypothetical protein
MTGVTDSNGRFVQNSVRPDNYSVLGSDDAPPFFVQVPSNLSAVEKSPELLETLLKTAGAQVQVKPGSTNSVVVTTRRVR